MGVAMRTEEKADESWKWKKHRTFLIDGFTFKMPDTIKNQNVYPQHTAQKPGLGFPIARVVALISLATGNAVAAALGPYAGKQTGEVALFSQLFHFLKPGDVIVADRHY